MAPLCLTVANSLGFSCAILYKICYCYNFQEMADAHVKLAIRLAYLLHEVWSNIRLWQHEQKKSIAQLSHLPDILELLETM